MVDNNVLDFGVFDQMFGEDEIENEDVEVAGETEVFEENVEIISTAPEISVPDNSMLFADESPVVNTVVNDTVETDSVTEDVEIVIEEDDKNEPLVTSEKMAEAKENFGTLGSIQFKLGSLRGLKTNIKNAGKELKANYKNVKNIKVVDQTTYDEAYKLRTNLNKDFAEYESDRKELKAKWLEPLDEMMDVYKKSITSVYDGYKENLTEQLTAFDQIKIREIYGLLEKHVVDKRGDLTFLKASDIIDPKKMKKGDISKLSEYTTAFNDLVAKVEMDLNSIASKPLFNDIFKHYIANGYDLEKASSEVRADLETDVVADKLRLRMVNEQKGLDLADNPVKETFTYMASTKITKLRFFDFLNKECALNNIAQSSVKSITAEAQVKAMKGVADIK